MFKRISIELDGPICSCDEQDLMWTVSVRDENNNSTLQISCKQCKTKLCIPNKKFIANFKLDQPYPGRKEEEPKLTVMDGGKVIPIEPPKPDPPVSPLGGPTAVE